MQIKANGWDGLKSVVVTDQQAADITGGAKQLSELQRVANVKVCIDNTGRGLAILENRANLVKGVDGKYRIVGTHKQVQYILDELSKGHKGLTMALATESAARQKRETAENLARRRRLIVERARQRSVRTR